MPAYQLALYSNPILGSGGGVGGAVDKDIFERAGGHNKPSKSKNILGNNVLVFTSTLLSKSLSRGLQILRLLHNTKYES